jgi:hypothetical protein
MTNPLLEKFDEMYGKEKESTPSPTPSPPPSPPLTEKRSIIRIMQITL